MIAASLVEPRTTNQDAAVSEKRACEVHRRTTNQEAAVSEKRACEVHRRAINQNVAVSEKRARDVHGRTTNQDVAVSGERIAASSAASQIRVGTPRASKRAVAMSLWYGSKSTKIWFTPGSKEVSMECECVWSGQRYETGARAN